MRREVVLALFVALGTVATLVGAAGTDALSPEQATATPPPVACPDCAPAPPPLEAMRQADAAFVGRVISTTLRTDGDRHYRVAFAVERTWTSATVTEITPVDVPYAVWECGRQPRPGERWLIYARLGAGERLTIGHCDRSHLVTEDDPDLAALPLACDPVRDMALEWSPAQPRAGDRITVRIVPRGFIPMDFAVRAWPDGLVESVHPCTPRCAGWTHSLRALAAGQATVEIDAYGEDLWCDHSPSTFTWASHQARAQLDIAPGPAATVLLPWAGAGGH